jgi:hypothetical protein
MKKSSATVFSPAMELPAITKKFTRHFKRTKIRKQADEKSGHQVPPPSDEMISQLNRIGQEYPFCVYYKQKVNDPL